jgi:hypothetical protein
LGGGWGGIEIKANSAQLELGKNQLVYISLVVACFFIDA